MLFNFSLFWTILDGRSYKNDGNLNILLFLAKALLGSKEKNSRNGKESRKHRKSQKMGIFT